jgi:peptidyl-prolyl cis-trans isomerase D
MPFAVFRRHQRKLLAIFAILAMFGFVVADSLPRLLSGGPVGGGNPVVVELYGKSVRRSDLNALAAERSNANLFMAELTRVLTQGMRSAPEFFGKLDTRSLVDALVLQHEADRLGMPHDPESAREWLKLRYGTVMTRDLFEAILARFNNRVSGEQLLADIANQVRLANVRFLVGAPVVTPFDVFNTYRDQNERVSARAVGFRVEDYLKDVPEPSDAQVQAYYDQYKDVLPDPDRPTPGFKVPRQIQVETLSIDGEALARAIKDKLTEEELRTYYENRKAEFKKPSEFPDIIFAGNEEEAAKLTPPLVSTFDEVRANLAVSLAEERAQKEILDKFGRIKDDVMDKFVGEYLEAADAIAEAKRQGNTPRVALPKPESLKPIADKEGLGHEITPLLSRDRAEKYGLISDAEVGLSRLSGGRRFAEELFDTKSSLYEPIELTDPNGRRYLVRKLQDVAPHVPPLADIRPEVLLAWKTEQARAPAEKAAKALAEKVKAAGGKIQGEIAEGHPVITTDPVTRLQPGLPLPGQIFETGAPRPAEISQLPSAGPELRDAYFGLKEGDVAVAPDQPKTVFYVLTLNRRIPATFSGLYAPNGDYFRYRSEALTEAYKKRDEEWMKDLRAQAGLKPDWSPKDEVKTSADEPSNG